MEKEENLLEEREEDELEEKEEDQTPQLSQKELDHQLISACRNGNLEQVKSLLAQGASLSCYDKDFWQPLHWASFEGHHKVVAYLLQRGADDSYKLYLEEIKGDPAKAPAIPDDIKPQFEGDHVPKPNPVNSPLHWAAFKGHERVVWQLLLKGFSISEQDSCGNNALHLAAAGGRSDVVKILMSQGVDLSIQNWYGNDAVTLATAASTKQILEKAKGQIRCVATNFAFGPEQPQYLCCCCGQCFSEDASTAQPVRAFVGEPDLKPNRYCNECLFKIQEAEGSLRAALGLREEARHDSYETPYSPPMTTTGKYNEGFTKSTKFADTAFKGSSRNLSPAKQEHKDQFDSDMAQWNKKLIEKLTEDDRSPLMSALEQVKTLGGSVALQHMGQEAVESLNRSYALQTAADAVQAKRPLQRRVDLAPLNHALKEATEKGGTRAVITKGQRVRDEALLECKLAGCVSVCKGISLATHANDGDLARLKKCVNEAAGKNIDGTLLSEASALLRRLSTEVELYDVCQTSINREKEVLRVAEEEKDVDPFATGWQAPPPPADLPEGEEPPKVLPPTSQLAALEALKSSLNQLEETISKGGEVSANEAVMEKAKTRLEEGRVAWEEQQAAEEERIAIAEVEKIKREKKAKKKGKKGKGKKK